MKKIYLSDVYKRFKKENNRVRSLVIDQFMYIDDWPIFEISEYAIIRLQDNYNCFARDVTLGLATANLYAMSGNIYKPALVPIYDMYGNRVLDQLGRPTSRVLRNKRDALVYIRSVWNRNRTINQNRSRRNPLPIAIQPAYWEPRWFDDGDLKKVSTILNINVSPIISASAAIINPVDEMRPLRNYVAHRGESTGENFRRSIGTYQVSRRQPLVILMQQMTDANGRQLTRFENWCERFNAIAKITST